MRNRIRVLLCISAMAFGLLAHAQKDQPAATEALLIQPGDLLHVTILREPDLDQKVRVGDSGEITLPMIGGVQVRGMTPSTAATSIAQKYLDGGFLKHPDASVFVEEYASQQVSVLGQVAKPGPVMLTTPRTLIDVLAMVGGLTEVADRHILVEHVAAQQQSEVFLSNRPDDALNANVMIYPGDKILVPKAGIVYVLGDVGRPGGYVMQNESRITVLQALATAGGANVTASETHTRLIHNKNGQFDQQDVSLKDMERGEVPDLLLQANDVLYVPFSFGKHVVMGTASIMASTTSALIYAGH
jgi:polysaccharide biosynthesis/export protein